MGPVGISPGSSGAPPAPRSAGQALAGSTVDFLSGDWNVVRRISDHRTGQVGSFRGEASFRPCAAKLPGPAVIPHDVDRDEEPGQQGRVLAYASTASCGSAATAGRRAAACCTGTWPTGPRTSGSPTAASSTGSTCDPGPGRPRIRAGLTSTW